jgi:hypothetical protein
MPAAAAALVRFRLLCLFALMHFANSRLLLLPLLLLLLLLLSCSCVGTAMLQHQP